MKHIVVALVLALLVPLRGYSATTLFTSQADFEAAAGPTEALITTARQVALATQLSAPPGRDTDVGSMLTFLRADTRLGRSFSLEALQGLGITFDDDEGVALPLFDNALSIGDIDDGQNDDWEIILIDGPAMRAFGVVVRDNGFEAGEALALLDAGGATIESVDLSAYVGTGFDFVGVATDFDFFGVRFVGGPGDDIAVADFRFAVPAASWTATTRSQSGALRPTLIALNDGRLLRSGGVNGAPPQLFAPQSTLWSETGPLADNRRPGHVAALLHNGRVLIAGGTLPAGGVRNAADLFDPVSEQWSATNKPETARAFAAAVRMADGRILVAGGNNGVMSIATAEIYHPTMGTWAATGAMVTPRSSFAAARLPGGRILAAGGLGRQGVTQRLTECEIFDPVTGTWTETAPLAVGRFNQLMVVLQDQRVLTVGGTATGTTSAEIYDPATGQWFAAANPQQRSPRGAIVLPDGRVLVGGDYSDQGFPLPMEVYDPAANTWSQAAEFLETAQLQAVNLRFARLIDGRPITVNEDGATRVYDETSARVSLAADGPTAALHTATLMRDGRVLAAGGLDDTGSVSATSQMFLPQSGIWVASADMNLARRDHAAVLLNDGRVMVAGGLSNSFTATVELFDSSGNGQWSQSGLLAQPRSLHTANLLGDGSVLVAGGLTAAGSTRSVERWDPATESWSDSPTCLALARQRHTATTLLDGRVLIAGGLIDNAITPLAEIYDPVTGSCLAVASLREARSLHSATLLANGRVMVVGGRGPDLPRVSTEIYDPGTNHWLPGPPLGTGRKEHRAVPLDTGQVLVTGGRDRLGNALAAVEVFDPVTNRWFGVTSLVGARRDHRATVLFDGRVLVHGGRRPALAVLASAEILDLRPAIAASARPVITGFPPRVAADDALTITGTGFSTGSAYSSDLQVGGNHPTVVVRRLDNGAQVALQVDATRGWSPTRFSARAGGLLGGPALVTVVTGGIPSAPAYLLLEPPLRLFADSFEN